MNNIGIKVNIIFFLRCATQTVIVNSARAARSWLALPNTGQIDIDCPLKVNAAPTATVIPVATNLFLKIEPDSF